MASDPSRVLVIGSTGYFGKFMVDASIRLGHPTFALVRESTQASDPEKAKLIESFKSRGVNLVYGDVYDKAKLVATLKQVDIVICTLSHRTPHLYEDEVMLILAIKEAGNIKDHHSGRMNETSKRIVELMAVQMDPNENLADDPNVVPVSETIYCLVEKLTDPPILALKFST